MRKQPYEPSVWGVGYRGVGDYATTHPSYKIWQAMLQRCYSKEFRQYHNYGGKGVTVCEDWHNFQNFAKWYDDNYIEGYHLDKDAGGGMEYSPSTCTFMSQSDNTRESQSKTYMLRDPEGNLVTFTGLNKFGRKIGSSPSNILRVLSGKGKSVKGYTKP